MSSTMTETAPGFTKLVQRNNNETVTRDLSIAEPRAARSDEIPVIDLSGMNGSLEDRRTIATKVKEAATKIGFFYIKNHGIGEDIIQDAATQCTS